jgi:homogentisate 1,2-dioxygenase
MYQYYHRNMATEILGIVYGDYKGTSRNLAPGGLSFQPSYMPHGGRLQTFHHVQLYAGDLRFTF